MRLIPQGTDSGPTLSLLRHDTTEEYEDADALLKTHMDGEEFKALLSKAGELTESLNARFYQD